MSLCQSGFFWNTSPKVERFHNTWIPALLELVETSQQLTLVVHPSEPIYETVNVEEQIFSFPLDTYKRCLKFHKLNLNNKSNDLKSNSTIRCPTYQIFLYKRIILHGHELKIGFYDKESQQNFSNRIKIHMKKKLEKKHKRLKNIRLRKFHSNEDGYKSQFFTNYDKKRNIFNEIANFMMENKIYEAQKSYATEVEIIPTTLSRHLNISGIYLVEIKNLDILLLDYIDLSIVNKWSFKTVRSFGYNDGMLYILTGSRSIGGRGLLIFASEKGHNIMKHLVRLMKTVARESLTSNDKVDQTSFTADFCPKTFNSSVPCVRSNSVQILNAIDPELKKSNQRARSNSLTNKHVNCEITSKIQAFCRSAHCCTTNVPNQNEKETDDPKLFFVDGDDGSLGELQVSNQLSTDCKLNSSDSDCESNTQDSITSETLTNIKVLKELNDKEDSSTVNAVHSNDVVKKDPSTALKLTKAKLASHGQTLKKCFNDFFGHSTVDINQKSCQVTHPISDTKTEKSSSFMFDNHGATTNSSQNDSSNNAAEVRKTESMLCRISKSSVSTKAVQLIKWRDLTEKPEFNSEQILLSNSPAFSRISVDSAGKHSDFDGSDIIYFTPDNQIKYPINSDEGESMCEIGRNHSDLGDFNYIKRKKSNKITDIIASTTF